MARNLRRIAICTFAGLLYYSGLFRLRSFFRRKILGQREVSILGLHRVLSKDEEARANSQPGIVLKEATFEKMLEFIGRRYRVVKMDDFLDLGRSHVRSSKPPCLITFDDGWRDNYTTAFPLLKKHGLPAVIFLVTGLVEEGGVFWVEQLIHEWRDPDRRKEMQEQFEMLTGASISGSDIEPMIEYFKHMQAKDRREALAKIVPDAAVKLGKMDGDAMLTWDQVLVMYKGGVEFESHTATHPLLVYEDDQSVEYELRACKQALEKKLNRKVRAFAYPNGTWDERVRNAVEKAGYECAFTTERGVHRFGGDPYAMRRVLLHEGNITGLDGKFSPALLNLRLSGWY